MPDSRISSGPVDVLASGTIISFKGNPIEVAIRALPVPLDLTPIPFAPQLPLGVVPATETVVQFKFIFRFQDDPKVPDIPIPPATIEAKTIEPLTLEVTLKNFVSPLGGGNIEPLRVGKAFNRPLYLSYRVYYLQGGDKTLTYAVYQDRSQEQPAPQQEAKETPKSNA
jgi:hypothetical protein